MKLKALSEHLGLEFFGDPDKEVLGLRDYAAPKPDYLCFGFLLKEKDFKTYPKDVVWIVPEQYACLQTGLISSNFKKSLKDVLQLFSPREKLVKGTSHLSDIAEDASVQETAFIDSFVRIGSQSKIGKRTQIFSNVSIGKHCSIGDDCIIHPGVCILDNITIESGVILHPGVKIGGDGLGFYKEGSSWQKLPHLGSVIIKKNVEIGSNTCIDRGVIGDTVIEEGVKIDSLVHIAHNVEVGSDSIVAALTGISGSVKIGCCVTIGGQVGISDHTTIADGVFIYSRSGVTKSVLETNKHVSGFPAQSHRDEKRKEVQLRRLLKRQSNK